MSARDLARQVLRRVEQGEAFASLALSGAFDRADLSPADRGLATELVYGVLRHRTRLDRALRARATHGLKQLSEPALIVLRVAAYQILFLRVPAHAAVNDAVEAMKPIGESLAKFANAVLRKLAAEGEPPPPPATDVVRVLEELESMPRWLGQIVVDAVGKDEAVVAAEAMNRPAPLALRANLARTTRDELLARLAAERPDAELAAWPHLPEAVLARGAGAPETLGAFVDGFCTVQDVAAQLVGRLCGAAAGERILDACAGVGGKSTHLAELSRNEAAIDAADLSARKLDLAQDAARRLDARGIRFIACDLTAPGDAIGADYDRVILDAPCSGLGVLRRHPEGKWRRRPAEIRALAELQARLLDAVAPRVRPGGALVYSVCTFTEEEAAGQARAFLARQTGFRVDAPPPEAAPFADAEGFIRTWPHRHDADGFFAVRLVKAA